MNSLIAAIIEEIPVLGRYMEGHHPHGHDPPGPGGGIGVFKIPSSTYNRVGSRREAVPCHSQVKMIGPHAVTDRPESTEHQAGALSQGAKSARQQNYDLILSRVRDLPSLPEVVNKIVETLGLPNASAAQVAKLIALDPGLTSKVLRMVNSAAYGFQRQISSVQHAIMILGFTTVRGLVLSASIFKLFEQRKHKGLDPTEFWRHSIGTAIAARMLSERWHIPHADDAFSAALLHDIGKIVLDTYFNSQYNKVIQEARVRRIPCHGDDFIDLEQAVLCMDHAELGYQIATKWKLPTTFAEVIRNHHVPQMGEKSVQPLIYVVSLANAFSNMNNLNHGIFAERYIPKRVMTYFNYDAEATQPTKPFKDLFDEIRGEMSNAG